MGWVVALVVLALVFAVVGLVIEAVKWLLIIAGVLLVAGFVRGFLELRSTNSG
jgi:hypothetical protein